MENLKPCPFCGSRNISVTDASDEDFPYRVGCDTLQCLCEYPVDYFFADEQEAIEAWNTRASQWISVKDRLPKKGDTVLLFDGMFIEIGLAKIDFNPGVDLDFTHWQPLPEPPTE